MERLIKKPDTKIRIFRDFGLQIGRDLLSVVVDLNISEYILMGLFGIVIVDILNKLSF